MITLFSVFRKHQLVKSRSLQVFVPSILSSVTLLRCWQFYTEQKNSVFPAKEAEVNNSGAKFAALGGELSDKVVVSGSKAIAN